MATPLGSQDGHSGASPCGGRHRCTACWSSDPSRPGDAIAVAWSPASIRLAAAGPATPAVPPLHTPDKEDEPIRRTDGRLPPLHAPTTDDGVFLLVIKRSAHS
ncbi:uncharacterized protein LOC123408883 [Hordeum vulgare subsp. vulgare]|uniref:uncharacterized protein LOC123408883 n=1 Tax=Hordeum vulgare subsp. vulgare TaxID=112509 RepID=UPI001D1A5765|nr:uncharacterized protein LOC123408883 [Hordeum vulgare subsp. vulgare]